MSGVLENARPTMGTATRPKDVSQLSGMCPMGCVIGVAST